MAAAYAPKVRRSPAVHARMWSYDQRMFTRPSRPGLMVMLYPVIRISTINATPTIWKIYSSIKKRPIKNTLPPFINTRRYGWFVQNFVLFKNFNKLSFILLSFYLSLTVVWVWFVVSLIWTKFLNKWKIKILKKKSTASYICKQM